MDHDYRIGDWTVRPHRNCIECGGRSVHLAPKAMAVLQCLADASNAVVSRHELFDTVWPGAEVSDDALTQRISELRKAFGDSPHDSNFIETIPKIGFRLMPEVRPLDPKTETISATGAKPGLAGKWVLATVLLFVVLIAVMATWFMQKPDRLLNVEANPRSIAVMPLVTRSGLAEDEILANGIHDELLTSLHRIPNLNVISDNSLQKFEASGHPIMDIAQELLVTAVLQGSVQRVGDRVRVQVQLVDPQTRENLWAETYDRGYTRDDIFSIQTGIALSISRMLKAELSTQVEAMMLEASTASLRASEHYWAARRLLASRNIADLKQARAEFEQAIAIDPGYALAWVGKADSLLLLASRGEITPPINGVNEAQQAIDRALALNEQLGEAYVTQGNIVKWKPYSKDREAERAVAYEKAIEFSPGYAPAYFYSGNMLNTYFEHHQAFNFYRKALDLDPASSIVRASMSSVLREIGRPEEALRILRPILRFDPDFASVYTAIGGIHAEQGRLAEAIRWYRQTERLDPDFWLLWMKLSDAFLAMEDYEGLADVRGRLLAQKGPDSILAFRSDFWAIFNRDGWQATLDWLDSLPPAWTDRNLKERVRQVLYVYVVAERYGNAYEHLIRTEPRWVEPEEWHDLIVIQRNGAPDHIPFDLYDSCVPAGVLIDAGEEALGRALINQTIDLLENEIGAVVDDIHRFQTLGVCYLLNGFYDKALEFFEDYVADGHFSDPNWIWVRQLPWWKPVRNDPRFIALLQQVAALQAEQRDLLERMRHNGELDTLPVF